MEMATLREPELRWATIASVAEVEAAGHLFDGPVRPDWARQFLELPTHHLCIAYVESESAGFVTGVEMTHPDKGTEMFLYELGVDDRHRGRGLGTALVRALADRARERGCHGMWALTTRDNGAAIATYRAAGCDFDDEELVLPTWSFG